MVKKFEQQNVESTLIYSLSQLFRNFEMIQKSFERRCVYDGRESVCM